MCCSHVYLLHKLFVQPLHPNKACKDNLTLPMQKGVNGMQQEQTSHSRVNQSSPGTVQDSKKIHPEKNLLKTAPTTEMTQGWTSELLS